MGFVWRAAVCIPAVLAFGCDDDGGGGGSPGGVPASTDVSELSEADVVALCEHYTSQGEDFEAELSVSTCTIDGVVAEAVSGKNCEEVRDACVEAGADDGGNDSRDEDCDGSDAPDCEGVTVGEWDACMNAYMEAARTALGGITCDTDLTEMTDVMEPETPAECKAIQDRCPELVPSDMERMGDVDFAP